MNNLSLSLLEWFSALSLMAVGGGSAVLTEMKMILLNHFGLSTAQFIHIYGLGQLAPGPNMLAVLALGQQIDGFVGAVAAGIGFFVPSSILVFLVGRLWNKIGDTPWRRTFQKSLEPISIGLMCSGVYSIGHFSLSSPEAWLAALVAGVLFFKTKSNPVLVIAGCGIFIYLCSFIVTI